MSTALYFESPDPYASRSGKQTRFENKLNLLSKHPGLLGLLSSNLKTSRQSKR